MIVTQGSHNQIKSHVIHTYIIIAYIAYFLHDTAVVSEELWWLVDIHHFQFITVTLLHSITQEVTTLVVIP